MKVRIGTRRSELAKVQAMLVLDFLESHGVSSELVEIESEGDVDAGRPLYETDDNSVGVFTKRLERALQDNQVDLAVHSLKDLPTTLGSGLKIAAIPKREVTADCLIVHPRAYAPQEKWGLRRGAKVGTSSLRREAQLLSQRPDLVIDSVRGNVPTRVNRVAEGKFDAVVLAEAGITRLKLDLQGVVKVDLTEDHFVPAPGQGAIAVEGREKLEGQLESVLSSLHHKITADETSAERAILRNLEGGCSLPLGVRCRKSEKWTVKAFLGILAGSTKAKEWKSFHHFESEGTEPSELVRTTTEFFRGMVDGGRK